MKHTIIDLARISHFIYIYIGYFLGPKLELLKVYLL